MRFKFEEVSTLPKLAWCARRASHNPVITVHHGSGVEIREDWFAEGPWDGTFANGDFATATLFCGTGAVVEAGEARFVSSSDRISPLFSISRGDLLFVSNSPVFVMVAAGEEPDWAYPFYTYDQVAIWRQGLHCLSGDLRLRSSRTLRMHFNAVIVVGHSGSPHFEASVGGDPPTDFESYRNMLAEAIAGIIENGLDAARRTRFEPIAAVSRGYDSNAVAALASDVGCRRALTLTDHRMTPPDSDSGALIAAHFGLACSTYDRFDYLEREGMPEVEFGLFPFSSTATLAAAEDALTNGLLLTGTGGDQSWVPSRLHGDLAYTSARYLHTMGQVEFRLRIGLSVAAPPYVGAHHIRAIPAISESEEMKPWSIGGDYDRPLPRRLIEEAGLPRHEFGQSPKQIGGSVDLHRNESMSPATWADYERFLKRRLGAEPRVRRVFWFLVARLRHRYWRYFGRRNRFVRSTVLQRRFPFLLNAPPVVIRKWRRMFTFQWTFDALRKRYEIQRRFESDSDEAALRTTDVRRPPSAERG